MANMRAGYALVLVIIALVLPVSTSEASAMSNDEAMKVMETARRSYIVYMDKSMKPDHFRDHSRWYTSMIHEVSEDPTAMLYTYDKVIHGFAANLTSTEAEAMENMEGCLGVYPDTVNQLHTTRTPDFLGLRYSDGLWPQSRYGDDVIVGVLDTGIWPERKSFSDQGLPPVPARWKGECEVGIAFNASHCNNKLIGARYFFKGYQSTYGRFGKEDYASPRDAHGHGTHTSSTAAGSEVLNASFLGFASGMARGMAPKARLAIYKVLWSQGGVDSDILAAMEAAVSDGVDLISMSIGLSNVTSPAAVAYENNIAIGALGAIEKGVFVSCSAGNAGPRPSSVSNIAPWIATVGASTIDREFPAPVVLGNGKSYIGSSLYKGKTLGNKQLPLVYGKTASGNETANICLDGSLDPNMVSGKVVLCDFLEGVTSSDIGLVVKRAGGAGIIVANYLADGEDLLTFSYYLPATTVDSKPGDDIKAYIGSTKNPTATIKAEGVTVVGKARAPVVASFSSRGPNQVVPEILKPDLIAPGVNILAAWTGHKAPTELISDKRRVDYNIISGTSMACPHVTGIAALLRAAHPEWSPAAIKSALMTSSVPFDHSKLPIHDAATGRPANAFQIGAGHVNPEAALDPGLVYDMGFDDYVSFLCSLNYTRKQIHIFTRKATSCPKLRSKPGDLNYPSFSVVFKQLDLVRVTRRSVTNVGAAESVYEVRVQNPPSVNIIVEPRTLVFKRQNEKANYTVRFENKVASESHKKSQGRQGFGQISWKCVKSGMQVVRSPVAIVWKDK